ncbi:MAG TPA: hypothetical protein DEP20_02255 [Fusobacteria bacterium]|nr:hypothetical protein [Fusobacteriota bacterium]|tara:strand:- start:5506 stop:6576 length:1071 start_codon:yes stop_codon:yes gene_type:complete
MKIYLDNASSTPMDNDVVEHMTKISTEIYANPSSVHSLGQKAKAILEDSREKIANLLGCSRENVIFTGSASEANSMVVTYPYSKIAISAIDHPSIHEIYEIRENVTELNVDSEGEILEKDVIKAQENGVELIATSHINSELGSITSLEKIRKNFKGLIHSDSVQAIGKVNHSLEIIDSMTISPHKFHGPKGIGILIAKDQVKLSKLILGKNRERNRRGGTENVAAVSGAALALEKVLKENRSEYITSLRNYFEMRLNENLKIKINASKNRAPHISNISFYDIDGELLLFKLDMNNIFVSSGSACNSGSIEPSRVLKQIGLTDKLNRNSIRFSFSKNNTKSEVDFVVKKLIEIIGKR